MDFSSSLEISLEIYRGRKKYFYSLYRESQRFQITTKAAYFVPYIKWEEKE